ncbi:MAG: 3'-5' exonuclease, partial [Planctomycetota bacterium]
PDAVGLFNPTERTYGTLVEIVKKSRLKLIEPVILEKTLRFSHCRQLAHIERNVFELDPPKIDSADNIRIISAPNSRAEVRFVAKQILELVRNKGFRYRDIAVIASDIESYQHYIMAYFDDYEVPFFIDKKKPLNHHPVVQLVCSALQVVTGGFASNAARLTSWKTIVLRSAYRPVTGKATRTGILQAPTTGVSMRCR